MFSALFYIRHKQTKGIDMRIYRLHHKDYFLRGFYTAMAADSDMYDDVQHPSPVNDPKLMINARERNMSTGGKSRYAFASIEQMQRWISKDEWKERLYKMGILLSEIEVEDDHCAIGDTQAIFCSENYKIVNTREIKNENGEFVF